MTRRGIASKLSATKSGVHGDGASVRGDDFSIGDQAFAEVVASSFKPGICLGLR